jgi:peptidoglycan/LPS O-acetylase OafA/YrhL
MSGFLLGFLYSRGLLASRLFVPVVIALALILAAGIFAVAGERWLQHVIEPLQRLGNKAHLVMMFVSLLLLLVLAALVRCGLNVRFASKAAAYSYTLYLIHYPLLLLWFALLYPLLHGHGWVPSALASAAAFASVVWIAARVAPFVENRELFRAALWGARPGRMYAR